MGIHRFSYVLMPHFMPHNYANVVQAAYAFNAGVRAVSIPADGGESGSLPALVACEHRNIVVESVKRAEDGDGIIVRLYECHNSRGRAELACARRPRTAELCNLEEAPVAELEVQDGLIAFEFRPFEILTLRLRF
jgi:alpha-mannosidase